MLVQMFNNLIIELSDGLRKGGCCEGECGGWGGGGVGGMRIEDGEKRVKNALNKLNWW